MDDLALDIADDGNSFKLHWKGFGPEGLWNPPVYSIDVALLQQAASAVRRELGAIAFAAEQHDAARFATVLRRLAARGQGLYQRLLPGDEYGPDDLFELKRRLEPRAAGLASIKPVLAVTIDSDRLFVPWGLVFSGDLDALPRMPSLTLSDMAGFWLTQYAISVCVGANRALPRERKASFCKLYALHEDMFTKARSELPSQYTSRLNELLRGECSPTMDWDTFQAHFKRVANDNDSVLFFFGHSDGQRISLRQDDDDPRFEFLAGNLRRFRKDNDKTASLFFLNGCRTSAPDLATSIDSISANFLKETRQKGYYGFVGTETEIPNVFAAKYGIEFLWKLCVEGKAVGTVFDELLESPELFPQNILYTCYAERRFRFAGLATAASF